MTREDLEDLYHHMEWADELVWRAVLASDAGRSDKKIHEVFYHLHMVERAFLEIWRGQPPDKPYPTFEDAESLMNWGHTYYAGAFAHLAAMTDDDLTKPMPMPWADMVEQRLGRKPDVTTNRETALQVVMHSQYHRGQINARLREVGGEPPLVDYIAWVWLGRPAASWEST